MKKKLNIGLFGYGCVGSGLYKILNQSAATHAEIVKICVKNRNKIRDIDSNLFTYDMYEILNDEQINVVVELIDNSEEAFVIVSEAMKRGKSVVSANKKMIAEHFEKLKTLEEQYNVSFLYEASVGGSIPIIRILQDFYANDPVSDIRGILNGTTNFILSNMKSPDDTFLSVLSEAQKKGFAESDPTLDIEGFDSAYKLSILVAHAFGVIIKPENILRSGISNVSATDVAFAARNGCRIRLVASATADESVVNTFVLPVFVSENDALYNISDEFNAIEVNSIYADKQLLKGRGAGSLPTASAVLSDIIAHTQNYRYACRKVTASQSDCLSDKSYPVYIRFNDNISTADIAEREWKPVDKDNSFLATFSLKVIEELLRKYGSGIFIALLPDNFDKLRQIDYGTILSQLSLCSIH